MAPLTENGTPLPENIVYTNYIPKFVIGLSIVYILSFLIRCIIRKYRRLRDKRQQQEIQQLKLKWQNNMKKHRFKDSLLIEQQEKIIECPPSAYNESFHSSSSSTLNSPTIPYNNSSINFSQFRSLSTSSSCSTASSVTLDMSKHYHLSNKKDIAKKVLQQRKIGSHKSLYWKINKNKKLGILWQWSILNGYVEYQHAKNLNSLIDKLSNKEAYNTAAISSGEIQVIVERPQRT